MNARAILIVSLGANVLLGFQFAAKYRRGQEAPPRPEPLLQAGTTPLPAPRGSARSRTEVTPLLEFRTNFVAGAHFNWSQIETNNLARFAANLRDVGCPERTVRHVVLPRIERRYAEREDDESVHPFWESAPRQSRRRQQQQIARRALAGEKRLVVQNLLGLNWTQKEFDTWVSEEDTAILLCYLPDAKALEIIGMITGIGDQIELLETKAHGLWDDSDREELIALSRQIQASLAGFLSPFDYEELVLRSVLELQLLGVSKSVRLAGVELSAYELRTLTQLALKGQDLLTEMLLAGVAGEEDFDQARRRRGPEFEADAEKLLGRERYAAYQRAQDEKFQHAHRLAMENGRTVADAAKAYALQREAELEIAALREAPARPENLPEALETVRRQTEKAIREVLGENGSDRFVQRFPLLPKEPKQ